MRELFLKVTLGITGVLFLATAYPLVVFVRAEPALSMMLSLYVVLGVFLLLAIPHPSAHRSLIAFAAWSSLGHAALMGTQCLKGMVAMSEMFGVGFFILIGLALLALSPRKPAALST